MPETHDERAREREHAARIDTESTAAATGHKFAMEAQSRQVNERKHNPRFYDKYTRSSLEDSEKWSHLVNEYAPWLADDHVLSNRRQVHRLQRQLLNQVRAEQSIAGATPGVRLREKPLLNALSQGVHPELDACIPLTSAGQQSVRLSDNPAYCPPMDTEERTVMDDVAAVATARQAMGVDKAGSEALTTATTESRTVREEEGEESGAIGSISGVFD